MYHGAFRAASVFLPVPGSMFSRVRFRQLVQSKGHTMQQRVTITAATAGADTVTAVRTAVDKLGPSGGVIRFAPGRYDFFPDRAPERLHFITNNDSGLKRCAFPLYGRRDIVVDGGGAEFVFHGRITPFIIDGCSSVTLKNLTIDWADDHCFQGIVSDSGPDFIDLALESRYPYVLRDGYLVMKGEGWEEPVRGLLEMDPQTGAPAYGSGDHCGAPWHSKFAFERLDGGLLRIRNDFPRPPKKGNVLVLTNHTRLNPAVFITGSSGVVMESVTIFQSPAMAVIAQRSADIRMTRCSVVARPGSGRLFSASADATHFCGCRGTITLEECRFEHQLDDATNVHGVYAKVVEATGPRSLLCMLVHPQQKGVPFAAAGDRVQVVAGRTLVPYVNGTVDSVAGINADCFELVLTEPVAGGIRAGDAVENRSWCPDVEIRGCAAAKNRARSFLIGTPGRVVIENNRFASGGAGVHIGAEARFWFESGAVGDVLIAGNTFEDCNYGFWSRAAVEVSPAVDPEAMAGAYAERNIRINGNTFRTFDTPLLCGRSIDGVEFSSNDIAASGTWPPPDKKAPALALEHCRGVRIAGNVTDGKPAQPAVKLDGCR